MKELYSSEYPHEERGLNTLTEDLLLNLKNRKPSIFWSKAAIMMLDAKIHNFLSYRIRNGKDSTLNLSTLSDALGELSDERLLKWTNDPSQNIQRRIEIHLQMAKEKAKKLRRDLFDSSESVPLEKLAFTEDQKYYIAKISSKGQFEEESAFLEHCLGGNSLNHYLPLAKQGKIEIFTIRDSQTNLPVVTIEYNVQKKTIDQIKSSGDRTLDLVDEDIVRHAIELVGFLKNISVFTLSDNTGKVGAKREVTFIADLDKLLKDNQALLSNGSKVHLDEVAEDESLQRDVLTAKFVISASTKTSVVYLTNTLQSDVVAKNATQQQIFQLRKIGGFLDMGSSSATELPENLSVASYLLLRDSAITKLPNSIKIGTHLYLDNTKIENLPESLVVPGNLYLINTPITSIPLSVTVHGKIILSGTPISVDPVKRAEIIARFGDRAIV